MLYCTKLFRDSLRKKLPLTLGVLGLAGVVSAQSFSPQGTEYSVTGEIPGDQINLDIALGVDGGYIVWDDNHSDGYGAGVRGIKVGTSGNAAFEPFSINSIKPGNQERPRIVSLAGGGYFVVWQGGEASKQKIYGKGIDASGVFVSNEDRLINTHNSTGKLDPAIAALTGGNAVVAWGSYGQDDASNPDTLRQKLQGVYAQVVSPSGDRIGNELQANQSVSFNQRTPAVAALNNGGFVVTWVSESLIGTGQFEKIQSVNIMGRVYASTGLPAGGEFQINTSTNVCANPSVVTDGNGFTVVWGELDIADKENSWDIMSRHFPTASGVTGASQMTVNSFTYGDQYGPRISGKGDEKLVVWTSLGQDGSREGIYGQYLNGGVKLGIERRINTRTVSRQVHPVVGAFSDNSMLAVWSGFMGGVGSFDIQGQRLAVSIPKPAAPILSALNGYEILVAWAPVDGFDIASYHLFVDGAASPVEVTKNYHNLTGLFPGTSHSVRLAFKLADGRVSPLSDLVTGSTWGADLNYDGLPDDWQTLVFGANKANWGSPLRDFDQDGVSDLNEFLAGTNPNDAASVLKMQINSTGQGWRVGWNSVSGLIYKLQGSSNLSEWADVGGFRFSHGNSDSAFVDPTSGTGYYRVIRIR